MIHQIPSEGVIKNGDKKKEQQILVVFDADETLWTFEPWNYVSRLKRPLQKIAVDTIVDSDQFKLKLFPGTREALKLFQNEGILLSIASHNDRPITEHVLKMLEIFSFFLFPQINWDKKNIQVERIIEQFKEFKDMIFTKTFFFDDNLENIQDVQSLGFVECFQVGNQLKTPLDAYKVVSRALSLENNQGKE